MVNYVIEEWVGGVSLELLLGGEVLFEEGVDVGVLELRLSEVGGEFLDVSFNECIVHELVEAFAYAHA